MITEEWQSRHSVDGEMYGDKLNNKKINKILKKELMIKLKILLTDWIRKCKFLKNN